MLADIPFAFQAAALLAANIRPNHLVGLRSSGRMPWPPSGNFKDEGYIPALIRRGFTAGRDSTLYFLSSTRLIFKHFADEISSYV